MYFTLLFSAFYTTSPENQRIFDFFPCPLQFFYMFLTIFVINSCNFFPNRADTDDISNCSLTFSIQTASIEITSAFRASIIIVRRIFLDMRQTTNGILRILGVLMLIFMMQDILNLVMLCLSFAAGNINAITILVTVCFAGYVIGKAVSGIFGIIYYASAEKIIRCVYASVASIVFCILYMLIAFATADGAITLSALVMNLISAILIPAVFIYVALKTRQQLMKDV